MKKAIYLVLVFFSLAYANVSREDSIKKYFDSKGKTLDKIEGIWSIRIEGTWRNPKDKSEGKIPSSILSRIAIVKEKNGNFDYKATLIESKDQKIKEGDFAGRFRKTAYTEYFEGECLLDDQSFDRQHFSYEDDHSIKMNRVRYDSDGRELSQRFIFIKDYPFFVNKDNNAAAETKQISGGGTGLVISKSGRILTAQHIIEKAKNVEVSFPELNVSFKAEIELEDEKNDLAIIKIKDFEYNKLFKDEIPFALSTKTEIDLGEEIYTIGFPLFDILGTAQSRFTEGTVSSTYGIHDDPRMIQVSAPVQPGNSGGPLFDNEGNLLGVIIQQADADLIYKNKKIMPQNINFAIKSNFYMNLVAQLPQEEADEILSRENKLTDLRTKDQVRKIKDFVVLVTVY